MLTVMHTLVEGMDQFNWTMFNALVLNRDCCPAHTYGHTTVDTMKMLVYPAVVLRVRDYMLKNNANKSIIIIATL